MFIKSIQPVSILCVTIFMLVAGLLAFAPHAMAAPPECAADPSACAGTQTPAATNCTTDNCKNIARRALEVVNFLAAMVGIAVTAAIIMGGIQYTAAADNPQQLQAAKTRIRNAIVALLAFIFLYAFLQWLVPGGVFD